MIERIIGQIELLKRYEQLASIVYELLSNKFISPDIYNFFFEKSREEKYHIGLINSALSNIQKDPNTLLSEDNSTFLLEIDEKARKKFLEPYSYILDQCKSKSITLDVALENILKLEIIESTNPLFLYYIEKFSSDFKQVEKVKATIDSHQDSIKDFVKEYDETGNLKSLLKKIPTFHEQMILIVDDLEINRNLLEMMFSPKYLIHKAENGEEALKKIDSIYYDLVISDMEMPIMNGKNLYLEAIKQCPDISKKFLFFTGATTTYEPFFKKHNLPYLEKPAGISKLLEYVPQLIQKFHESESTIDETNFH